MRLSLLYITARIELFSLLRFLLPQGKLGQFLKKNVFVDSVLERALRDPLSAFHELNYCPPFLVDRLSNEEQQQFFLYKQKFEAHYAPHAITMDVKIPRVIHFIWLGPKAFPASSISNVISWKQKHPDWVLKFWTDDPARKSPILSMETHLVHSLSHSALFPYYQESDNWGEKSDILRYIILWEEGGLYIDHDTVCYQPFDVFHHNVHFYCAMEKVHRMTTVPEVADVLFLGNCVIGAQPRHPILEKTMRNVMERWRLLEDRWASDVLKRTVIRTFSSFYLAVRSVLPKDPHHNLVLPSLCFFPDAIVPSPHDCARFLSHKLIYCNHAFSGDWLT